MLLSHSSSSPSPSPSLSLHPIETEGQYTLSSVYENHPHVQPTKAKEPSFPLSSTQKEWKDSTPYLQCIVINHPNCLWLNVVFLTPLLCLIPPLPSSSMAEAAAADNPFSSFKLTQLFLTIPFLSPTLADLLPPLNTPFESLIGGVASNVELGFLY